MASEPGDECLRPPFAEGHMCPVALAFGGPTGALGQLLRHASFKGLRDIEDAGEILSINSLPLDH